MLIKIRWTSFFFLLVCCGVNCRANQARDVLLSIVNEPDDSQLPNLTETILAIDASKLSFQEVSETLPLARQCILSSRSSLKAYGLDFLFSVAMRPDGSELLEAYINDLAALMSSADHAVRRTAIATIGHSNRKPSPRTTGYLVIQLTDKGNTSEEIREIAAFLLQSSPDAGTVHNILAVVKNKGDAGLRRGVILAMGSYRIQVVEALTFIRESFSDQDPRVRGSCVDAVGRMPKDLQDGFSPELQRMVGSSDELQETRSRAQAILAGIQ